MEPKTLIIIASIVIPVIAIIWFAYRALRRYSCCGTCGCDLMSKKERKVFEARKAELAQQIKTKSQG